MSTISSVPLSRDQVFAALDQVYDPELDAPLTRLGFIDEVTITGGHVTVRYTVPTFWCAPNFVFLMSSDIRHEVARVPGVAAVTVLVRNNCAENEINAGINAGKSFAETFPDDLVDEGLEALRHTFTLKGFLARQDVLLRRLRQAGIDEATALALRVGALTPQGEDVRVVTPDGTALRVPLAAADLEKYLHKRRKLGLAQAPEALLFTTTEGQPLAEVDLAAYLRRSRAARLNIAFNTTLCEGLLRTQFRPEQAGCHGSVGDALLVGPALNGPGD
ncbi:MAG: iron-sulfur cluster assembly protein [Chloroflexi bacterium OHK40]